MCNNAEIDGVSGLVFLCVSSSCLAQKNRKWVYLILHIMLMKVRSQILTMVVINIEVPFVAIKYLTLKESIKYFKLFNICLLFVINNQL